MRRLLFVGIFLIQSLLVMGQEVYMLLDSMVVEGMPWTDYAIGLKVDSYTVENQSAFSPLNQLLQNEATVYLKTYGEGQLATLNIRGTSAAQNAIFWEGINTNITSLGLSDFSLTPLSLVDQVAIQYGAASSLFGSDVAGGSIHLGQKISEGQWADVSMSHGSFNRNAVAMNYNDGIGPWQHKTNIVHRWAANNFTYQNTKKRGTPEETMDHAEFRQSGLSHTSQVKIAPSSSISLHLWYQYMDRNIQPTFTGSARDDQIDETSRILLSYHLNKELHNGSLKLARLSDRIEYNGAISIMPRYYLSYEHEIFYINNLTAKLGANWQYLKADIDAYEGRINEHRNDIYLLLKYSVSDNLNISANLRQGVVEGFNPPFTPSLGFDYQFTKNWFWKASISRSFRVPTLNDRYWTPGGNPLLRPEEGNHMETTIGASLSGFEVDVTAFYGDIKNWIIWRPEGIVWTPDNVDQVRMSGLEANLKYPLNSNWQWQNAYAYNQTTRLSSDISLFEGKQLEYTPFHQFTSKLSYQNKKGELILQGQWTDDRFTNADNSQSLDAFFLLDAQLICHPNEAWTVSVSGQNLLNTDYQLMVNRALPGRNFQLNLKHRFNFNRR